MKKRAKPWRLKLNGLKLAPPQVYGGIRLVPVLRKDPPGDLRLHPRKYRESFTVVTLEGELLEPGVKYVSYVPHGLVVTWNDHGQPAAAFGANLKTRDGKTHGKLVRVTHRMAKREASNQLRILPLHLAMEGFLSLHFGGPEIAWSEYSRRALSRGLDPRFETSVAGRSISKLDDALRVFEIHDQQVGALVFVADALASAFVTSHYEDYRRLHRSLLEDFYGALLFEYGQMYTAGRMEVTLEADQVRTLDGLAEALHRMREAWAGFQTYLAEGILDRSLRSERVYRCGPFQLLRFVTDLDLAQENHIGETIVRADGTIEYLKTDRLSAAQARRAYLLSSLAAHHWNIEATAAAHRQTKEDLVKRLDKAGFGYLLQEDVLRAARQRRR